MRQVGQERHVRTIVCNYYCYLNCNFKSSHELENHYYFPSLSMRSETSETSETNETSKTSKTSETTMTSETDETRRTRNTC